MLVYPGPVGIPSKLPIDTPPAFMVIAADDAHTSVSAESHAPLS